MEKITMMGGTLGYMAPELPYTGKATKESDVYSFGILMLEVVCGRTPINLQVEDANEDFLLLHSVWRAHEAGNILKAVEPGLLHPHRLKSPISSRTASDQITLLINAADPEARPSMRGEQSYYADSPMATLNLIPPLPSTMPIYGDLLSGSGLQAPKSSKAPLDMLKRNKFTVLRSRFLSC